MQGESYAASGRRKRFIRRNCQLSFVKVRIRFLAFLSTHGRVKKPSPKTDKQPPTKINMTSATDDIHIPLVMLINILTLPARLEMPGS